CCVVAVFFFFFFQAEDGIRDGHVTGVQTCALPILVLTPDGRIRWSRQPDEVGRVHAEAGRLTAPGPEAARSVAGVTEVVRPLGEIGRASCRERVERGGGAGGVKGKREGGREEECGE